MRSTTSSWPSAVVSSAIASHARVQRRLGAVRVGVVALAHLLLDRVEADVAAGRAQLAQSAPRPLGGVGVEEELHLGVGEHGRADVAAVEHHAALFAHLALARHHLDPHAGVDRDERRGPARLARARLAGHVVVVEQHALPAVGELDARRPQERGERLLGVERDAGCGSP
jgi:hypothetical protein